MYTSGWGTLLDPVQLVCLAEAWQSVRVFRLVRNRHADMLRSNLATNNLASLPDEVLANIEQELCHMTWLDLPNHPMFDPSANACMCSSSQLFFDMCLRSHPNTTAALRELVLPIYSRTSEADKVAHIWEVMQVPEVEQMINEFAQTHSHDYEDCTSVETQDLRVRLAWAQICYGGPLKMSRQLENYDTPLAKALKKNIERMLEDYSLVRLKGLKEAHTIERRSTRADCNIMIREHAAIPVIYASTFHESASRLRKRRGRRLPLGPGRLNPLGHLMALLARHEPAVSTSVSETVTISYALGLSSWMMFEEDISGACCNLLVIMTNEEVHEHNRHSASSKMARPEAAGVLEP